MQTKDQFLINLSARSRDVVTALRIEKAPNYCWNCGAKNTKKVTRVQYKDKAYNNDNELSTVVMTLRGVKCSCGEILEVHTKVNQFIGVLIDDTYEEEIVVGAFDSGSGILQKSKEESTNEKERAQARRNREIIKRRKKTEY